MKIVICISPGNELRGMYELQKNEDHDFRLLANGADQTFILLELPAYASPLNDVLHLLESFSQCEEYRAWRGDDNELFVWVHRSNVDSDEVGNWPEGGHLAQVLPLDGLEVPIVVASRLGPFLELWRAIREGEPREEHGQCIRDIAEDQGSGHRANDGDESRAPNGPNAPEPIATIKVHRAAELLLHELNGILAVMRLNLGQEGYERIKRRLRTALDHEEELMEAAVLSRVREEFESGINLARDFCSTTDDTRQRIQDQLEQIRDQLEQIRKNVVERSAPPKGESQ